MHPCVAAAAGTRAPGSSIVCAAGAIRRNGGGVFGTSTGPLNARTALGKPFDECLRDRIAAGHVRQIEPESDVPLLERRTARAFETSQVSGSKVTRNRHAMAVTRSIDPDTRHVEPGDFGFCNTHADRPRCHDLT